MDQKAKDKSLRPRTVKGHFFYLAMYLLLLYFGIEGLITKHTDIIIPGVFDHEDARKQAVFFSSIFIVLSGYGIGYTLIDMVHSRKGNQE